MNKICIGLSISVLSTANLFADGDMILPPNSVVPNACVAANTGVYEDSFVMVPVYEDAVYVCNPGYYLPAAMESCELCPQNNYCVGGGYKYNETTPQGIMECPNMWYSPAGMYELASCGRILHIGDNVVYLRSAKKTTPSLNIDIDNDGEPDFFGNITTDDVVMHSGAERKLKLNVNGTLYSVYDDTVEVSENTDEPSGE